MTTNSSLLTGSVVANFDRSFRFHIFRNDSRCRLRLTKTYHGVLSDYCVQYGIRPALYHECQPLFDVRQRKSSSGWWNTKRRCPLGNAHRHPTPEIEITPVLPLFCGPASSLPPLFFSSYVGPLQQSSSNSREHSARFLPSFLLFERFSTFQEFIHFG